VGPGPGPRLPIWDPIGGCGKLGLRLESSLSWSRSTGGWSGCGCCWLLAAGCSWLLDAGCWLLAAGGCWLLVAAGCCWWLQCGTQCAVAVWRCGCGCWWNVAPLALLAAAAASCSCSCLLPLLLLLLLLLGPGSLDPASSSSSCLLEAAARAQAQGPALGWLLAPRSRLSPLRPAPLVSAWSWSWSWSWSNSTCASWLHKKNRVASRARAPAGPGGSRHLHLRGVAPRSSFVPSSKFQHLAPGPPWVLGVWGLRGGRETPHALRNAGRV
jgi:hypothetical protein